MKSTTDTLIEAMQILSREIHSDDGIANAAILEASERLKEQDKRIAELESFVRDYASQTCECGYANVCSTCKDIAYAKEALKGGDS